MHLLLKNLQSILPWKSHTNHLFSLHQDIARVPSRSYHCQYATKPVKQERADWVNGKFLFDLNCWGPFFIYTGAALQLQHRRQEQRPFLCMGHLPVWSTVCLHLLFHYFKLKQNKVSLSPFSPKRLIPSSDIYLKKPLLISMYIDV